jgi:hypothetical protein
LNSLTRPVLLMRVVGTFVTMLSKCARNCSKLSYLFVGWSSGSF